MAQVAIDFQINVAESDVRKLGDLTCSTLIGCFVQLAECLTLIGSFVQLTDWWRMGEGDGTHLDDRLRPLHRERYVRGRMRP